MFALILHEEEISVAVMSGKFVLKALTNNDWNIVNAFVNWIDFIMIQTVRRWTLFVRLTMKSLWMLITTFWLQYCLSSSGNGVDCLRVAICSTVVRCYWCISICIIIPAVGWCSLLGPHWSAVMLCELPEAWIPKIKHSPR